MIQELSFEELNFVAGGLAQHYTVRGAEYIGAVNGYNNGVVGHYDMYQTPSGDIFGIWHAGSTVN